MIGWTPGVVIGADVGGVAQIQCCWAGTSLSTPLWAGYSRVIAKQYGSARLGLLNPTIYSVAQAGLSANGIEDVTVGNNSFNGVNGFTASTGYDQVSGWGSVDMTAFAAAYKGAPQATPSSTPSPTPTASQTPKPTAAPTPMPTMAPTPMPTAAPTPAPATPTPKPTPGWLKLSQSSISFGSVKVGHLSAASSITLSNPASSSKSANIISKQLPAGSFKIS